MIYCSNRYISQKFIEDPRRYRRFVICTSSEASERHSSKPLWKDSHYVTPTLSLEEFQIEKITFNKALAVGLCILDESKRHMMVRGLCYFEFRGKGFYIL